ncbi:MAG: DUF3540 domain-containing protein [Polyangiaceae bacterium]
MELPPEEQAIETSNGTRVAVVKRGATERIEVRDRAARLIFELDTVTNKATLTVPEGDLAVHAPNGNIDLVAGGRVAIQSKSLDVSAERAELKLKDVAFAGLRFAAKLGEITIAGERIETRAERIFERARSVFRTADDLAQLKAGRARTVVQGSYALRSGHTTLESKQETKIDGAEILLG